MTQSAPIAESARRRNSQVAFGAATTSGVRAADFEERCHSAVGARRGRAGERNRERRFPFEPTRVVLNVMAAHFLAGAGLRENCCLIDVERRVAGAAATSTVVLPPTSVSSAARSVIQIECGQATPRRVYRASRRDCVREARSSPRLRPHFSPSRDCQLQRLPPPSYGGRRSGVRARRRRIYGLSDNIAISGYTAYPKLCGLSHILSPPNRVGAACPVPGGPLAALNIGGSFLPQHGPSFSIPG